MQLLSYAVLIGSTLTLYAVSRVVYRLFFHPLARIPGPKLAAATQWYEAYIDIFWKQSYWREIEHMHAKYGPIVRITPDEVHISDPEYFDTLYCNPSSGIRDKYKTIAQLTGTPLGLHATTTHNIHRLRRGAVNAYFSVKSIVAIEPLLQKTIDRMCKRFVAASSADRPVELRSTLLALTTDAICERAMNSSMDLLGDEQRGREWYDTIRAITRIMPVSKQLPWVIPTCFKTPLGVLQILNPTLARVIRFLKMMEKEATAAVSNFKPTDSEKTENELDMQSGTIFDACLTASQLPPEEKKVDRLTQEAFTFVAAGGETTARMIAYAVFYILQNKERVVPKLKKELEAAMPDPNIPLEWKAAEQLPWLSAVIKESLRIGALFTSRFPLVAPKETLRYGEYAIPSGYPVSMTVRDTLLNGDIFENPLEFRPERWLADNPDLPRLNKYYIPFSRGSRMCIGINLAYAELYLVLSSLFRRFDMELFETSFERDVHMVRDGFVGETVPESPGIRVKVRPVEGYKVISI